MFDPRNMWIVMAICVAAFLAYTSFQPSQSINSGQVAYLRTPTDSKPSVSKIDQNTCLATKQRVWAVAADEVECIAYLAASEQPDGTTALIFFHGDIPKKRQTTKAMNATQASYLRRANWIARKYKIPVFVMARPGVLGSTGFHSLGGVRREHTIIASAVSELKQRYGLKRLVIGGQSGGARLTAQLLASRRDDIKCAVMASGAYGVPQTKGGGEVRTNTWGESSRYYLIPLDNVDGVLADNERRLFVVGDLRDQRTSFDGQRKWAEALKRAGHKVELLQAAGSGKEFHGLSTVGMRIAGMCAAGESDQAISTYVRSRRARTDGSTKR